MSKKTSKSLIALGSVVAGLFLYESFFKTRKIAKDKKNKKFIEWEVEFKENTNDHEKAKVITEIEKHLIDYLYEKEDYGGINRFDSHLEFEIKNYKNQPLAVIIICRFGYSANAAVRFPPPKGPQPGFWELIKSNFPSILSINNLMKNENLNRENTIKEYK